MWIGGRKRKLSTKVCKHCMVVTLSEFHMLMPVLMTLIHFQGHSISLFHCWWWWLFSFSMLINMRMLCMKAFGAAQIMEKGHCPWFVFCKVNTYWDMAASQFCSAKLIPESHTGMHEHTTHSNTQQLRSEDHNTVWTG